MAQKIRRYDVLEQRQRAGDEWIIYKGYDPLLQQNVMIKEPLPQLHSNRAFMEGFLNEGKRLRTINDETVAKFIELIPPAEVGGKCYLVMEYVEESVEDLLKRGPVDIETGKAILKDALMGLKVIHQAGLVHGNICPGSILITPEGRAKLTDLRIAWLKGPDGSTTVSSSKYLPHEVLAGDGQIGAWSDLYSLGCLAYEMFLGSSRFEAQFSVPGEAELGKREIKDGRYREWHCDPSLKAKPLIEIDNKIPEPLSVFVARLMEKAIDLRYRSADHALRNLGVHRVVQEEPSEEEKKSAPSPEAADEAAGAMFTRPLLQVVLEPEREEKKKQEKAAAPAREVPGERRRAAPARETRARPKAARETEPSTFLRDALIVVGVVLAGIVLVALIIKFL